MVTLFDAAQVGISLLSGMVAFGWVTHSWGPCAGVLAAVVAALLGWWVGRLPLALSMSLLLRELARASTSTLLGRLEREPYIAHLIVAELARRGAVEAARPVVLAMCSSNDPLGRRAAERIHAVWFEQRSADDG